MTSCSLRFAGSFADLSRPSRHGCRHAYARSASMCLGLQTIGLRLVSFIQCVWTSVAVREDLLIFRTSHAPATPLSSWHRNVDGRRAGSTAVSGLVRKLPGLSMTRLAGVTSRVGCWHVVTVTRLASCRRTRASVRPVCKMSWLPSPAVCTWRCLYSQCLDENAGGGGLSIE